MQRIHLYSFERRGFYARDIHADKVPTDAVELSDREYSDLLYALNHFKDVAKGEDGRPKIVDRLVSLEHRVSHKLSERDAALAATDAIVAQYQEERDLQEPTTIAEDVYRKLLAYRKALRDLPKAAGFPNIELPAKPA